MESSLNDLAVRYLAGKGVQPTHQNVAIVAQAIADGTISQTQSRGNEIIGRMGGTLPAGGLPQFDVDAMLNQQLDNETGYVDPVQQAQMQMQSAQTQTQSMPAQAVPVDAQMLSDAQLMGDAGSPPAVVSPASAVPSVASNAVTPASPALSSNPAAPVTDNGAQSLPPNPASASSRLSDDGWTGMDTMTALGAGAAGLYGANKLQQAMAARRNGVRGAVEPSIGASNPLAVRPIEGELLPRTGGALFSPVQDVPRLTNQMPPDIQRVPPDIIYGEPPIDNIDVQEIQPTRVKPAPAPADIPDANIDVEEIQPTRAKLERAPDQIPPSNNIVVDELPAENIEAKPVSNKPKAKAKAKAKAKPAAAAPVDEVIGYDELVSEPSADSVVIDETDDPTANRQAVDNVDEASRPVDAAEVMGETPKKEGPAPAKMGRGQKAEGFDRRNAKRFMTSVKNAIDGRVGEGKLNGEIRRDGARNYLAIVDSNGNEVRRLDGDTQKQAFEALKQYASSGEMLNDSRGIKPPQQAATAATDTPKLRGRNAVTRQSADARTEQIRNAAIRQLNRNNIDPNMLRVEVDEAGRPRYFMKFTDRGGSMEETGPFSRIRDIIEFANNSQALAGDALVIDPAERTRANAEMFDTNAVASMDDQEYEKVMQILLQRKQNARDTAEATRLDKQLQALKKAFDAKRLKGVGKAVGSVF